MEHMHQDYRSFDLEYNVVDDGGGNVVKSGKMAPRMRGFKQHHITDEWEVGSKSKVNTFGSENESEEGLLTV